MVKGKDIDFDIVAARLLKEFPSQSLEYIMNNISLATKDPSKFIAGMIDYVLPSKGKQVLDDAFCL